VNAVRGRLQRIAIKGKISVLSLLMIAVPNSTKVRWLTMLVRVYPLLLRPGRGRGRFGGLKDISVMPVCALEVSFEDGAENPLKQWKRADNVSAVFKGYAGY
jgi:hypothetical protein